ncbi:DUF4283 domain-containing protein [Citrus sinensis]|uniref:uncharacterized protein LOC107174841 n=1 Tax=Citrus sinensis TaxID=2711 RepID=UPI000763B48C|nr:uncharacterized protein LOC107174841 [Citrus sinensis]XP_024033464.1 uncharacterized protein LOC112095593 [Citrus x clementina]KAH9762495.1 DUF4283 domain-containing protein [Citrus sinensis]
METSLEKSSPPSIENNRSTKRVKFKAQGVDGDNPPPVSFRDKLLETQMELEEEFMGKEEDIDIDIGDVVIEMERFLPAISFSQKVHLQLVKPWQSTVVVKLLGRSIGYKVLCNRLEALWNMSHGFFVIDLENNYFLVRFKRDSNAQHVLTQGPWIVLGHYLTVQPWSLHFDSVNEKISSVVAWIRLPGMPLHYYHKKVLRLLGQVIRNVICIDYNTESTTRGKFARIAVEVALDKLLCSQFLLDSKIQKVEYESLPTICFECGIYGYLISSCQKKIANEGMSSNNPNKLMMLSNSVGINEDLLLSLNHYNDPSDGRQHSFNQSDDNSEDSDYMRDSAEQDGKSESADSLVFEDGIDAEQIVDTPDV